MTLGEILNRKGGKVWTVPVGETVKEALRLLAAYRVGALVVCDKSRAIRGILSERDIIRAADEFGRQVFDLPVERLMTVQVILGAPENDIQRIMAVMTEKRIRHIPVVANGELAGIVSIGDVVKCLIEDSQYQIQSLKNYLYGHELNA